MEAIKTNGDVQVAMTYDEAFVLSNLLFRWQQDGTIDNDQRYEHAAERLVLLRIAGALDYVIDEVFDPDFAAVVERKWNSVQPPGD